MPYRWNRFYQLAVFFWLIVALLGCSSGSPPPEEDIQPVSVLEKPVEETTAPPTKLPTELDEAAVAASPELPTELNDASTSPVAPSASEAPMTLSAQSIAPLPGSEKPLAAVLADLAGQVGTAATGDVTLVSMEATNWSDASLGCPQEGMMYAQVITPGYLMVLEADGQQYTYHTDQNTSVTLCEQ